MHLHDVLASVVSGISLFCIVEKRIPTGLLCTVGLGVICVGCLWSMDDNLNPYAGIDLLLAGIVVIGLAVLWKLLRFPDKDKTRRMSDWIPK